MQHDSRVDDYIAKEAEFAQPILRHVRAAMARAFPDAAETIKWGRPFWTEGGRILAMMSGFKAHMTFGPWRPQGSEAPGRLEAGWERVTSLDQLPGEVALAEQLAAAVAAVDAAPVNRPARAAAAAGEVPADFAAVLQAAGAAAQFEAFAPSARNDYLDWLADAKRPETRAKRMADAVGWIAEGKRRNWKYER